MSRMHRIRLRRPWSKRLGGQPESIRIDVPEAASDSPSPRTTAIYQRNFNRPPAFAPSARIHLRIEAWRGDLVQLAVNDHSLPLTSPPLTCEITEWLRPHNQICLELRDTKQQDARLSGEVVLLIERQDSCS